MPLTVKCGCGKVYQLNETLAGKKARCKTCGNEFRIPPVGDSAPVATSPAVAATRPAVVSAKRPAPAKSAVAAAPATPETDEYDLTQIAPAATPRRPAVVTGLGSAPPAPSYPGSIASTVAAPRGVPVPAAGFPAPSRRQAAQHADGDGPPTLDWLPPLLIVVGILTIIWGCAQLTIRTYQLVKGLGEEQTNQLIWVAWFPSAMAIILVFGVMAGLMVLAIFGTSKIFKMPMPPKVYLKAAGLAFGPILILGLMHLLQLRWQVDLGAGYADTFADQGEVKRTLEFARSMGNNPPRSVSGAWMLGDPYKNAALWTLLVAVAALPLFWLAVRHTLGLRQKPGLAAAGLCVVAWLIGFAIISFGHERIQKEVLEYRHRQIMERYFKGGR